MLFDLNIDPRENINVVEDPSYKAVVKKLDKYLEAGYTAVPGHGK